MAQQQGKRVKRRRRRKNYALRSALIAFVAVLAVAFIAVLGMGAFVAGKDTIYPNIQVAGVDVGGMTYETARATLSGAALGVPSGVQATAVLTNSVSVSVTSDEAGLTVSLSDAVDLAYAYGRDGGFFKNLAAYIGCVSKTHDVYSETVFDEAGVRETVAQAAAQADHEATASSYEVVGEELLLTRGSSGYTVDQEGVLSFIRETLLSGKSASTDQFSEAKTGGDAGAGLDFDAIYDEIYCEPVNASFDEETGTATAGTPGVSFDRAQAQSLFEQAGPGDTVRVPLTITQPEFSGTDPEGTGEPVELFTDKLAEKNTSLSSSNSNRITNVTLAAAAINGTVLNPGDSFSFNGTVGQRTEAKGYKPAGAYNNGQTVNEVGGGICQVSSTLYYCTLLSDLKIVKRSNHSFSVSYLPAGLDATVSWPNPDFQFQNNRKFPIKIVAWVESKKLYVEIWGTKENDNYVELESKVVGKIDYQVVEEVDETLAPGETQVKVSGHGGTKSEAYKLVYDGQGNLLSRTLLSKDTYKAQDRVILKGPEPTEDPNAPENPENPENSENPEDPENPGTTDPGTTDPGTTDPGTTDPGTTDPGTTDPGTTDPGTTDPGTTDPGTTDPGTTDPGTTDPGTTDPGTTDPGTTDPGTTDPGTTDPGTTEPEDPGPDPGDIPEPGGEDPGDEELGDPGEG